MLVEEVTTQQLKGAQNEGDKEDEYTNNDNALDQKDSIEDSGTTDNNTSDQKDSDAIDKKTLFEQLKL